MKRGVFARVDHLASQIERGIRVAAANGLDEPLMVS